MGAKISLYITYLYHHLEGQGHSSSNNQFEKASYKCMRFGEMSIIGQMISTPGPTQDQKHEGERDVSF